MKRQRFLIFVFAIFMLPSLAFGRGLKPTAHVGFVDFRQLLLNHPLFAEFNTETKRFNNTSSAWVENPEEAIKAYDSELDALKTEEMQLRNAFNSAVAQEGYAGSSEINELFSRLSSVKLCCAALESAKAAALVAGNYMHGASTPLESLVPVINTITGDIKDVCERLSVKYSVPIVDVSCFYNGKMSAAPNTLILYANTQRAFYRGSADSKAMAEWVKELRKYIKTAFPKKFTSPFCYGALDLRQEALSSMNFSSSGL